MNVCRAISEMCERFHDRVALIEAGPSSGESERRYRYGECRLSVERLCGNWKARGLERGDRVAALLDNSLALVASEWACLLTGCLWVSLNTRASAEELERILADCRPRLWLVGARHADRLGEVAVPDGCETILVGEDDQACLALADGAAPLRPRSWPEARAPVRIRYTSGTAGTPKGAVLTRACYDASLETVESVIGPLSADDVVVQVAPMTHAAGAMLIPHLRAGGRAVLAPAFDARQFIVLSERYRGTAVFLVPTMLIRVLAALDDPSVLASLRTIVYGGASMPVDRLLYGLELLGPVFVQIYGLTESTWPVTALGRRDHLRRRGEEQARWHARLASCGRPTAVGDLRIVGADARELGVGEAGEIWVKGRNTMLGYWGGAIDAESKGLDDDGWMHTGDVGFRDEEGFITIVDRLHDMIVSGGFNVYPREVEHALSSHPAVLECAVVGRPSEEWGEEVHAFVVLREGARIGETALIEHCGEHLAGFKKPKSIEFVGALPKNPSGKVLRRELRRRLRAKAAAARKP